MLPSNGKSKGTANWSQGPEQGSYQALSNLSLTFSDSYYFRLFFPIIADRSFFRLISHSFINRGRLKISFFGTKLKKNWKYLSQIKQSKGLLLYSHIFNANYTAISYACRSQEPWKSSIMKDELTEQKLRARILYIEISLGNK